MDKRHNSKVEFRALQATVRAITLKKILSYVPTRQHWIMSGTLLWRTALSAQIAVVIWGLVEETAPPRFVFTVRSPCAFLNARHLAPQDRNLVSKSVGDVKYTEAEMIKLVA